MKTLDVTSLQDAIEETLSNLDSQQEKFKQVETSMISLIARVD